MKLLWAIKIYLQLWFYLKFHTIEDFEASLWRIDSRVVISRTGNIYHLPRGGKVIVNNDYVEVIPADSV